MSLTLRRTDIEVVVADGDIELFRYVVAPITPQLESPKPYIHPIRTREGCLVSLFRPSDHVWHKGISWSLPVVDEENFWGGPTYAHGEGYVQRPNNGAQLHARVTRCEVDAGVANYAHELRWMAQSGRQMFAEARALSARVLDDATWALTFATSLTNVTDHEISIGSPTTKGRENAGYGGLFWRGPRAFTDGSLVTANSSGSGSQLRGRREAWMAFVGRHEVVDSTSLVVMVDAADNPRHPPQWFARSEEYAALNPAPFFSEVFMVAPGETATFRYAVGVADGDADQVAAVASTLRALL